MHCRWIIYPCQTRFTKGIRWIKNKIKKTGNAYSSAPACVGGETTTGQSGNPMPSQGRKLEIPPPQALTSLRASAVAVAAALAAAVAQVATSLAV